MSKILLIGDGNVAFHLRRALVASGHQLIDKGDDFDMAIFSITDNAYKKVIDAFPIRNKIMIHTSGSITSNIFSDKTKYFGVLYPLQTIKKSDKNLSFKNIPLFVTASDKNTQKIIIQIAKSLSNTVKNISDEQRLKLHLSAVFLNNFTNHMVTIAHKLAKENDIDISLLQPLQSKTFLQMINNNFIEKLQTGPAVRGDVNVMEKHMKLLDRYPYWQKIYTFVSKSIATKDK